MKTLHYLLIVILCITSQMLYGQDETTSEFDIITVHSNTLYRSGQTQTINFNASVRGELTGYIRSVDITFPASQNITVNSAELYFNGEVTLQAEGNIVSMTFPPQSLEVFFEQSLFFDVSLTIPSSVSGEVEATYAVRVEGEDGSQLKSSRLKLYPQECGEDKIPITVSVHTDWYPSETSWQLSTVNESVIYMDVENYPYSDYTYSHSLCLSSLDTVKFAIEDDWGDGICCYNGEGYYTIESPCGIIKEGAMFNEDEDTSFVLDLSQYAEYSFVQTSLGYRNDYVVQTFQDCDGGFIVFLNDENNSNGGVDIVVLKINAMGDIVWEKRIGQGLNDEAHYVMETSDGNFLVSASVSPQDAAWIQGYALKVNKSGEVLWSYLGEQITDIWNYYLTSVEINNRYFVVGANFSETFMISFSQDGVAGEKRYFDLYGYPYLDMTSIPWFYANTTVNNKIIIGTNLDYEYSITKIDTLGVEQTDFYWDNVETYYCEYMSQTALQSGNFFIAGYYADEYGNIQRHAIEFDQRGNIINNILYTQDEYATFIDVAQAADNTLMTTTYYNAGDAETPDYQLKLTKLNAVYNAVWEQDILADEELWSYDLDICADGGYAISGYYSDSKEKSEMFLIKTDDTGIINTVYQHEEICMVTVDPDSGKNLITWEKTPGVGTASYKIYKETDVPGEYELLGTQAYSEISSYVDEESDPAIRANRYKITCVNSRGLESRKSIHHKTMHLTINKGIGDAYNLIWDRYEGFEFSTYNIYRGTTADGLVLLASLPNTLTSFTDIQAPQESDLYYQVAVVKPYPCDPTSQLKSESGPFSQSLSNISESKIEITTLPQNTLVDEVRILPNPVVDVLRYSIELKQLADIKVSLVNAEGKTVFVEFYRQVDIVEDKTDVSDLAEGAYKLIIENTSEEEYVTSVIIR